MVRFDVSVVLDAVTMLLQRPSVADAVQDTLLAGDDMAYDNLNSAVEKEMASLGATEEEISAVVDEIAARDANELIKFIKPDANNAVFDLDEAYELRNPRLLAFIIPCAFDLPRFRQSIGS